MPLKKRRNQIRGYSQPTRVGTDRLGMLVGTAVELLDVCRCVCLDTKMNILGTLRKQISVLDYESCWSPNLPPASYERFVSYLATALQKQLPIESTDFAIGLQTKDANRVLLLGSFCSQSVKYSLHGEIVYLPGMDAFRGRPGFNRCLDHTFEMNHREENDNNQRRSLQELAGAVFLESQEDAFPKAL